MGRQIVYCEGCGHNLREDDFEKGRARRIDNQPFCTECRPFAEGEGAAPKRTSSGRVPAQERRKTSTGHIPIIPPPAQRRPGMGSPKKESSPLPIIGGVGGLLFIILIFTVTQSSTRKPPVVEAPVPPLVQIPPPRPAPPPVDPTPPPPPPPVRREPPPGDKKPLPPLTAPTAEEKFQAFLNQIAQIIRDDVRKERTEEVLNMFSAAAKSAGVHAAEVEKLKQDYLATLDEPSRRAAVWSDWKITSGADPGMTAIIPSHAGRESVYMTHPIDRTTPAKIEREVDVPAGKKTTLGFWVSCHQSGDFELRVYADGKQLLKEMVGPKGSGWKQKSVDLTPFAGKRVALRLENFPNDWEWEHAYWSDLRVVSE
jgi:hypothetical protein